MRDYSLRQPLFLLTEGGFIECYRVEVGLLSRTVNKDNTNRTNNDERQKVLVQYYLTG